MPSGAGSRGMRSAASWGCVPAASSTSLTAPSTAISRRRCATAPPSASSTAICGSATSPTPSSRRLTNRFANTLRGLGVGKGDHVFILAGRIPELYIAALGALKNGSVVSPLFSAFGPEPIRTRLDAGRSEGAGHNRGALPAQGRGHRWRPAAARARAARRRRRRAHGGAGHARSRNADGPCVRTLRRRAHERRRHGAAALHQRHDGHAQGRDPRSRRRRRRITRPASTRSTCMPRTSSGAPPTPAG